MSKSDVATEDLIEDIRDLWLQTEESRRVDSVEPQFEIEFFFQTAMRDAQLRLAALKSRMSDLTYFEAEVREITKELQLCRLIGGLLFSSDDCRRA
jgi:hypothetical protein